jgi:hypothetical protein
MHCSGKGGYEGGGVRLLSSISGFQIFSMFFFRFFALSSGQRDAWLIIAFLCELCASAVNIRSLIIKPGVNGIKPQSR